MYQNIEENITFFFSIQLFSSLEDGEELNMSLLIIFLSYIIGCISIIAISICLYLWFGVYPRRAIVEQEQFQTSHPFSEVNFG